MEKTRIFVSYAHKDREHAEALMKALSVDYIVESDTSVSNGMDWIELLANMIKNADYIIVIYSESYADSRYANDVLTYAIASDKRILPIVVGDVLIPFYLMHIQCLRIKDFSKIVPNVLEALPMLIHDTAENSNAPKRLERISENLDEVISALKKHLLTIS